VSHNRGLFAEKATSLFAEKPTSLFAKKPTLLFPAYRGTSLRNHGTKFRIKIENIGVIYQNSKIIRNV
jgi:hypothetical protein